MGFILSLAWKNLSRYRRRTIITSIAIAAGLSIFIMLDALLLGMERESEQNIIWYETASAKIMTPDNFDNLHSLSLKHTIESPEGIQVQLENLEVPSAPRVSFTAEILVYEDPFPADGSSQIKVVAVAPDRDREVFRFGEILDEGRFLKTGEEGILLGSWLAEDLKTHSRQ